MLHLYSNSSRHYFRKEAQLIILYPPTAPVAAKQLKCLLFRRQSFHSTFVIMTKQSIKQETRRKKTQQNTQQKGSSCFLFKYSLAKTKSHNLLLNDLFCTFLPFFWHFLIFLVLHHIPKCLIVPFLPLRMEHRIFDHLKVLSILFCIFLEHLCHYPWWISKGTTSKST